MRTSSVPKERQTGNSNSRLFRVVGRLPNRVASFVILNERLRALLVGNAKAILSYQIPTFHCPLYVEVTVGLGLETQGSLLKIRTGV